MRKLIAIASLFLLLPTPAHAVNFVISGIVSGLYYDGAPGPCTGGMCQTVTPYSLPFTFDLSDPAYGAVITGNDTIGYDFTAFLYMAGSGPATGRIVRSGNGYVGQYLSQSQFAYFGTYARGWSVYAPQFNVSSDTPPAVPEPGTWPMLIAGLATVGGALRRLRKRPSLALT